MRNLPSRCCRSFTVVTAIIVFTSGNGWCGSADDKTSGVIEGVVTYQADPKRPWRYGRYYIQSAKTGELAEAVVALRSSKLAGIGLARQPETVTIDQKNFQFTPETVAVRVGDSVTFTNSDDALHNVRTSGRYASFNVTLQAGGSHTVLCEHATGTRDPLKIGCVFHSAMQAWVFVFDHPCFQLTKADGRFRLEDVPPGEYDLEMIHPAGELRWKRKIRLQAGEMLRVDIAVSPDDKE